MTEVDAHHAPEKVSCPSCSATGEMSYNDTTTSFYCGACGTNHDIDRIPDKVEL